MSGQPFGTVLRDLRLASGLTQEGLAERAGVSAKAISDLERDPTRTPRLDTVTLLADALGTGRAELLAAARPGEPHPERSAGPTRIDPVLPRPLTPLIGRDGVAANAAEIVRRGTQLLTLTGPGGVGKTRLAIEVATRLRDDFPDGVAMVDLAAIRDPALVLTTIAQRLGLDAREGSSLGRRVQDALDGRRVLLLLDNFEQLVEARLDVLHLVEASPDLAVLVTSRMALRVRGEREYRVAPLALPEPAEQDADVLAESPAVQLFADRVGAMGIELDLTEPRTATTAAEICRRLEGLPLAIELAASRITLLPPQALLDRLDERLPLLTGGLHDLPARQQTMRDTIAWSYDLLDPAEQALFRQLCAFQGGCTLEAAEEVCDDTPPVLDGIAELVRKSLLTLTEEGEPRVRALKVICEFGRERLLAEGETSATRRRHATYYLRLADGIAREYGGQAGATRYRQLELEHDNFRAALRWARANDDAATAIGLSGALWKFWFDRGHLGEGRQLLAEALAMPGAETVAGPDRIRALIGAAMLAMELGAYEDAAISLDLAVALARASDDIPDLVASLHVVGVLDRLRDRYAESTAAVEEAVALSQATGDQVYATLALASLAWNKLATGHLAEAAELAGRSIAGMRALDDEPGVGGALLVATVVACYRGRYDEAVAYGTEGVALARKLGDGGKLAELFRILGMVAHYSGEEDRADALHDEALVLLRERVDELGVAESLQHLGIMALDRGELDRARSALGESDAIVQRYGEHWGIAVTTSLRGHLALAEDQPARAAELFATSAELHREIGNPLHLAWPIQGLAEVAAGRGEWELAARLEGVRTAVLDRIGSTLPILGRRHEAAMAQAAATPADDLAGLDLAGLVAETVRAARALRDAG